MFYIMNKQSKYQKSIFLNMAYNLIHKKNEKKNLLFFF